MPAKVLARRLTRRDADEEPVADRPTVLVILDCCFSGTAGLEILSEGLREVGNPNT